MPRINYYSSEHGTLAQRLDRAWSDYLSLSENVEKENALTFLIYAFDIRELSTEENSLNNALNYLMDLRNKNKGSNPNYVPILSSGRYHLDTQARELHQTVVSKKSEDESLQRAFDKQELLDVNPNSKESDVETQKTYLTPEERAKYSLEISNGLLYQEGNLFDSTKSISHNKLHYVAFTLNTNGELSVFEHLFGKMDSENKKLVHSSMNAGAPVLAAGELEIKDGKLISINTSSGHYQPTLYSVARFLEYLSDRGVDISQTKVYTQSPPDKKSGLVSKKAMLAGSFSTWYEIPATAIVHSVKGIIDSNIASLSDFVKKNEKRYHFKASPAAIQLSGEFQEMLAFMKNNMKDSMSSQDIKNSLEVLQTAIARYSKMHKQIQGKSRNLNNFFKTMDKQVQKMLTEFANHDDEAYKEALKTPINY